MGTTQQSIAATTCPKCGNASKRFGKHRNGLQRFRCLSCRKTFTEDHKPSFRVEDYLNDPRGLMAIRMLVEGCSIRTIERITEIRRDSIIQLLLIAGERCERRMNAIRNVPAKDVQSDEIWSYVAKKEAHKRPDEYQNDSIGDVWAWVALERNTKLILAFTVGRRTLNHAFELMFRLRRATSPASPAEIVEAVPVVISGNPNPAKICTSHVERQNLTMRMQIRRLTRLTNAFSKSIESHRAAIALHFAYYNWCRIHGSLRVTPAMEAGITDQVWTLSELLA